MKIIPTNNNYFKYEGVFCGVIFRGNTWKEVMTNAGLYLIRTKEAANDERR